MSDARDDGSWPLPDPATLRPDHAFVVEFRGGAAVGHDDLLCGRVEHVVSGKAARFESAGELLDFVRLVLRRPTP